MRCRRSDPPRKVRASQRAHRPAKQANGTAWQPEQAAQHVKKGHPYCVLIASLVTQRTFRFSLFFIFHWRDTAECEDLNLEFDVHELYPSGIRVPPPEVRSACFPRSARGGNLGPFASALCDCEPVSQGRGGCSRGGGTMRTNRLPRCRIQSSTQNGCDFRC